MLLALLMLRSNDEVGAGTTTSTKPGEVGDRITLSPAGRSTSWMRGGISGATTTTLGDGVLWMGRGIAGVTGESLRT
jgi:hypothetical protein